MKIGRLSCPICSKKCMSVFRKVLLGPLVSVKCKECNNFISSAWIKSILSIIPAGGVSFAAWAIMSSTLKEKFPFMTNISQSPEEWAVYGLLAGVLLITAPLYLFWVPLKLRHM